MFTLWILLILNKIHRLIKKLVLQGEFFSNGVTNFVIFNIISAFWKLLSVIVIVFNI